MSVNLNRIIGRMIIDGLWGALLGYTCGALGAQVLRKYYEGYSEIEAERAGALGNFFLAATYSGIKSCFFQPATQTAEQQPAPQENVDNRRSFYEELIGQTAIASLTPVAGGAIGYAMLKTVTEMPLDKIVATMAVGSGVLLAVEAGIVCLALAYLCCFYQRPIAPSIQPDVENPQSASFRSMSPTHR